MAGWLVRLVSPLPSRFTAQISHGSQHPWALLSFMNTILVLSGDHSGASSKAWNSSPVKIASFWPFGSIVRILHAAVGCSGQAVAVALAVALAVAVGQAVAVAVACLTPANAILVPSGDQSGACSSASVWVRLVAFCPFASITKMSDCSEMTWPGTSLTKTSWAPDGAHDGWYSRELGVLVRLV